MLKVLGVSAPYYVRKPNAVASSSLNSSDPFSLYNAFRVSAQYAQEGDEYWGRSNWNSPEGRDSSIVLMDYFYDEAAFYLEKLCKIKPNLLLIGTMTLGFAGAIEIAKLAKKLFGEDIFIVLGGKHVNETLYLNNHVVQCLPASPLKLMETSVIPKVFDLVVSGDGEEAIWQIGRALGAALEKGLPFESVYQYGDLKRAKGTWIMGWLDNKRQISTITSSQAPIDYDRLLPTAGLFRTTSKFNVFDADLTAHAMSYLSPGCVFNCYYCSEGCAINGSMRQKDTAPQRLYNGFEAIVKTGLSRYNTNKMSAFVEDSILLGGFPELLDELARLLQQNPLDLVWGCQFTADKLLDHEVQLAVQKLAKLGLRYIFVGLETNDDDIANQFSKNKITHRDHWITKNEKVIEFLSGLNLMYGVSLLFGLGETHESRIALMKTLISWKKTYGIPNVFSLNLAVQHPLQKFNFYDYVEWGTPADSEYLEVFTELFGEASVKYRLPQIELPSVSQLKEIQAYYQLFNKSPFTLEECINPLTTAG